MAFGKFFNGTRKAYRATKVAIEAARIAEAARTTDVVRTARSTLMSFRQDNVFERSSLHMELLRNQLELSDQQTQTREENYSELSHSNLLSNLIEELMERGVLDQPYLSGNQDIESVSISPKINSGSSLYTATIEKVRSTLPDYAAFKIGFNTIEPSIRKSSQNLFEILYWAHKDKKGEIPQTEVDKIIQRSSLIVIGLVGLALYEYAKTKIDEIKSLDARVVANYSEVERLYNESLLMAQNIVAHIVRKDAVDKKTIEVDKLLELLDKCSKSQNDSPGIIIAFKNMLQAQLDSFINDKPIERALIDGKIQRELLSLGDEDPNAAKLLELKGGRGFIGTENFLKEKAIDLKNQQEEKDRLIQAEKNQIDEITKKIQAKIEDTLEAQDELYKNLFVQYGLYQPKTLEIEQQCNFSEEQINALRKNVGLTEELTVVKEGAKLDINLLIDFGIYHEKCAIKQKISQMKGQMKELRENGELAKEETTKPSHAI